MRKKYLFFVLFSLLLSCILTGCSIFDEDNNKTAYQLARERQGEIMEYIKSGDKEKLKSFFADDILEAYPQIDDDIDGALDFIEGEITVFYGQAEYINSYMDAPPGYTYYGASSFNINTNKDNVYVISFWGLLTDEDHPKEAGVTCIRIKNITKEWPDMPKGWQEHWRDYKEYVFYIGEPCI